MYPDDAEDETTRISLSTENLFIEKNAAYENIAIVNNPSSPAVDKDNALARLRRIFDKYLECPMLLDREVGEMVTSLMQASREIIISFSRSNGKGVESEPASLQGCAHSLSAIYALSKVRGRKTTQKFLSHEVEDVEPILQAFQQLAQQRGQETETTVNDSNNNSDQPQRWESLYVLWNWLGTLSLVPFDCSVVLSDSSVVISNLMDLGKTYLSETGPTREASAACLAAWLSKPDLEQSELPKFVQWSCQILQDSISISLHDGQSRNSNNTQSNINNADDIFLQLGVMQTLVTIPKVSTSPREKVLSYMSPLWEPFIRLAESTLCDNNLLLRKLMVKWWSRMGCLYLPPRIASWRYQRGRRSLVENLQQAQQTSQNIIVEDNTSISSSSGDKTQSAQHDEQAEADVDFLWDMPTHVEDAMGYIVEALNDPSTAVRWPAAKGIGRLTERLPSICADDVLDAVLELFTDPEADRAWHGACLALAELARRGLLLPNRLSEVVPLIVRAIQYDLKRGQTSVGAHVRDAACYTYWSFARAYAPSVLKPYVSILSKSIILTCLFDREVNCRRAASAAFQECVGRQGADNFKHGISILTTADYFSLGNRNDSFTSIAFQVAKFLEYRRTIIDHVYQEKLCHWDSAIRTLASKSLFQLSSLDPKYVATDVIPSLLISSLDPKDIPLRHGSILGLAEGILGLSTEEETIEHILPKNILVRIAEIVPTIEKNRLYRGRGGEIIRGAVCRLISCICAAKIPLSARQQVRHLDSIDACLPHPKEEIQAKACDALRELTTNYFPVGPSGPSDRLQKRVVDKYLATAQTSENPASTRGFTLAFGYLPAKLLAPSSAVLDSVVNCLCSVSRHDAKVVNEKDAETRRNSLVALRRVCQTVGLSADLKGRENSASINTGLNSTQVSTVFEAFFTGLEDYNVDRRGDVGSWPRCESMKGLETITCLVVDQASPGSLPRLFNSSLSVRLIGGLLKQFSEKLDTVRVEAGRCLQSLLTKSNPEVPFISKKRLLQECLGLIDSNGDLREGTQTTNWADASVTFPMVAKIATVETYFSPIIAGLVISVGGLTESVAKQSNAALLSLVRGGKDTKLISDLGRTLLDMFKYHSRKGRVILPLLKTVDILLSHQCLDDLLSETNSAFKASLLLCISKEAKNCSDVHRLFACIDVTLGLVSPAYSEGSDKALAFACSRLFHRFPRVRRYAAEQIYVCLLENPDLLHRQDNQAVLDSILNFGWDDAQVNVLKCREMAESLAGALKVPLGGLSPKSSTIASSQRQNVPRDDDFASYAALVDSAT